MPDFRIRAPFEPHGDQPPAIAELEAGVRDGARFQTLLGGHGDRQDAHHGPRHRPVEAPRARHVAQQDARRAALRRAQVAAAGQRGRVLRLLLRLLPARGVHPRHRHLHREGRLDQRGHRAAAPARHLVADRAAGRGRGRVGVVHLRPRQSGRLPRPHAAPRSRRGGARASGSCAAWSTSFTSATTSPSSGASSGCAATRWRCSRPTRSRRSGSSCGGDEVERITRFDPLTGETISVLDRTSIYPASHYVTPRRTIEEMAPLIREEMAEQVAKFREAGRLLEAQRIETRTNFDIEMMLEMGTCPGIENYSRYTSGRRPGERPACLLDYFPEDFLIIVDESHVTIPQIHGMYRGDRSRKVTLVDHGFRLPSAIDNRPLTFDEWYSVLNQVLFVSATPGGLRAGALRRRGDGADHPPHGAGGSADRRTPGARARWTISSPRSASAPRATSASWSRPSPSAWPRTWPSTCSRWGCGCGTCTPTSTRSSGWRSCARCAWDGSTCWSGSTCCARGSTCPRCRWWRSWTPTRRDSCATPAP